jgi:hypothetical protein
MDDCRTSFKHNLEKLTGRNEWDSMTNCVENHERGSVEAGLAIVPTTILFLLIIQLIVAQSWQSLETARLHDEVNRILISAPGDELRSLRSQLNGKVEFDVSENRKLLTITKEVPIPIISTLLGDKATVRVHTLAYL